MPAVQSRPISAAIGFLEAEKQAWMRAAAALERQQKTAMEHAAAYDAHIEKLRVAAALLEPPTATPKKSTPLKKTGSTSALVTTTAKKTPAKRSGSVQCRRGRKIVDFQEPAGAPPQGASDATSHDQNGQPAATAPAASLHGPQGSAPPPPPPHGNNGGLPDDLLDTTGTYPFLGDYSGDARLSPPHTHFSPGGFYFGATLGAYGGAPPPPPPPMPSSSSTVYQQLPAAAGNFYSPTQGPSGPPPPPPPPQQRPLYWDPIVGKWKC